MSYRKESVCPLSSDMTVTERRTSEERPTSDTRHDVYPFALVLRLRVLQVVCGISALVMGTVAFIEERGKLNLALAVPAGCATVLAAGETECEVYIERVSLQNVLQTGHRDSWHTDTDWRGSRPRRTV
jgi:hypothetical protein